MKKELCTALSLLLFLPLAVFATGQNDEDPAVSASFNAEGYPIVDEPVTLTIATEKHALHGNFDEMEFFRNYEEKTGVSINWVEIPQANHSEKVNLLFASNDLPDIFFGGNAMTDSHIVKYGTSGTYIPLNDLIDQYAPNIKRLLEERPEVKKTITAPDGNIYSLPAVNENSQIESPDNMFINKKWLDRLGLEVPTTIDEFHAVLKAFREQDPNGNGKADEIPWSYVYNNDILGNHSFFGAFGVLDSDKNHLMVEGGKVVFTPVTEGYKETLKFLNKLYGEGLIDAEAYTQSNKEFRAKGKTEDTIVGVFSIWLDENMVGAEKAHSDYVMLPPLKSPGHETLWSWTPWRFVTKNRFSITSSNPHPEISIRWADWFFTETGAWEVNLGPFDTVLEKDENGTVSVMDPPEGMTSDEFTFNSTANYVAPSALYSEMYENYIQPLSRMRKYDRWKIYSQYFPDEYYPDIYFTADEVRELEVYLTDIHNYVDQMEALWVTGGEDIDSDWDGYVDRLQKMGLDKIMQVYQDGYDRFLNN